LEVAGSLWAKFMGLMGRPSLDAGAGLWLPDSNGIHMMFMRFPIDAVFLGKPVAAGAGAAEGPDAARGGAGGAAADAARAGGAALDAARGGEVRPVVSVHAALRTWTGLVPFVRGAHGVLELPLGTIATTGTVPGDLIRLEVAAPGDS
jgi:uncharacterized membrane protein (UPF0127 family)